MPSLHRLLSAVIVAALGLWLLPAAAIAQDDAPAEHTSTRVVVESRDTENPVDIVIQVFQPAGSSAANPVPVILDGHGWGGSRRATIDSTVQTLLDSGYGVVSIDQRGFGESTGRASSMDPDREGADLIAVMDHVAALDWVEEEKRPGNDPSPFRTKDPVVGAIGGSYGGGYQYLLALLETKYYGETRLDALAPEITWHNLNVALAPNNVLRSAWTSLLTGVAAADVEPYLLQSYAYSMATGQIADGTVPGYVNIEEEFFRHGPAWYVSQGIQLDVPTLARQGMNDSLFIYNQALDNFTKTLTPEARAQSTLVGYNGGHVLPTAFPVGGATAGDPCSQKEGEGGWSARRLEFFDHLLKGEGTTARVIGDGEPFHFATMNGGCLRMDAQPAGVGHSVIEPTGVADAIGSPSSIVMPTTAGAPLHLEIDGTDGVTVAGVPTLDFTYTSVGADTRVFLAISRGTSLQDAQVIQQNVEPLRSLAPVVQAPVTDFDLAGIAAELDEGEKLFLTIAPMADLFAAHGSRTPGAVALQDITVNLPIVD